MDVDDLWFELNYGDGLNLSMETILNTPYDTLSHWHNRMVIQKKYELAEANKKRGKK